MVPAEKGQRGTTVKAGANDGSNETSKPLVFWILGDYESIRQRTVERIGGVVKRVADAQRICKTNAEEWIDDLRRSRPDVLWIVLVNPATSSGTQKDRKVARWQIRAARTQHESGGRFVMEALWHSHAWRLQEIREVKNEDAWYEISIRWCNFAIVNHEQLKSKRHVRIISNGNCPQIGQCLCPNATHATEDDPDVISEGMFQTMLHVLYEPSAVPGHACVPGDDGQRSATGIVAAERLATICRGVRATPFGRQLRAPSSHPARTSEDGAAALVDCKVEALAETGTGESYPTQQRLKQKQRHKDGIVAQKRPQIVEQVFDDCGEDMTP